MVCQTATKGSVGEGEASVCSDEQVKAKGTNSEAAAAKPPSKQPGNGRAWSSKTNGTASSTNNVADREKTGLEKFEKTCQRLAIVARHPRPTPPARATLEKDCAADVAVARIRSPPLKTARPRHTLAAVTRTGLPMVRPTFPRLNPAAREFKSGGSRCGVTEPKLDQANASNALRWLLGRTKTCLGEDESLERAVEVFGDIVERRLRKKDEEREREALQLLWADMVTFPFLPPPTFQPLAPSLRFDAFTNGLHLPARLNTMMNLPNNQAYINAGAITTGQLAPPGLGGPVSPMRPPQIRSRPGMRTVHTDRPALPAPPALCPSSAAPSATKSAPAGQAGRITLSRTVPSQTEDDISTLKDVSTEKAAPSKDGDGSSSSHGTLEPLSRHLGGCSTSSDPSEFTPKHSEGSSSSDRASEPPSNDEGPSSTQTSPDLAGSELVPTTTPFKLRQSNGVPAPENISTQAACQKANDTTYNRVVAAPSPAATRTPSEPENATLPSQSAPGTQGKHLSYPPLTHVGTSTHMGVPSNVGVSSHFGGSLHMAAPAYTGGLVSMGGPAPMGPKVFMPPAPMRSIHNPFPCGTPVFGPAPTMLGPPPPVPKPKNPDPEQQQAYEQWIEWRKANEPGYAQECKQRQIRRAQRSKMMGMPQNKSSHRSVSSSGGVQN